MIRVVNIVALAITVMFAFGLYNLKDRTSAASARLNQITSEIEGEQEALKVLRAEWSHLNRPERIEQLANRYLSVRPVDKSQIRRIEDVPFRPLNNGDAVAEDGATTSMGGPEWSLGDDRLVLTRGGKADD